MNPADGTIAALERTAALWMCREAHASEVAFAAAEALDAGVDSPHLRELAGLVDAHDAWDVDPVISATLRELHRPPLDYGSERVRVLAVSARCIQYLAGRGTPQRLIDGVERILGTERLPAAHRILALETWKLMWQGRREATLEAQAALEARRFVEWAETADESPAR